jgi:hypothetical protein
MASAAQINANRENAKKSHGPTTEEGKQASSRNNFRHGLSGHVFLLMSWEKAEDFDLLLKALQKEYKPETATEHLLVEKMAQQHWLSQRAQTLLTMHMSTEADENLDVFVLEGIEKGMHKRVSDYLRYQTQHERLFQRALHDLLKLRAEKRKEQIGFESQKHTQAAETRREAAETRRVAAENRKIEEHKITLDIKNQRLDREKSNALLAGLKAGEQMSKVLPPEWEESLKAA